MHGGGEESQCSTRTDNPSLPLSRQKHIHQAVQTVCKAAPGVLHSGVVTMDPGGQGDPREGPAQGRQAGVRTQEPVIRGQAEGAGHVVAGGQAHPL